MNSHANQKERSMTNLLTRLWNDEAGFIVSAELILVATIVVLAMVVGLSEVAISINHELEDVGCAFGSINQSYQYLGIQGHCGYNTVGSSYLDKVDFCDCENITSSDIAAESSCG